MKRLAGQANTVEQILERKDFDPLWVQTCKNPNLMGIQTYESLTYGSDGGVTSPIDGVDADAVLDGSPVPISFIADTR